jgi:hypothetical protein
MEIYIIHLKMGVDLSYANLDEGHGRDKNIAISISKCIVGNNDVFVTCLWKNNSL